MNYTNRLYRRELKKFAGNLDLKSLADNRKFWDLLLPLLSSKGKSSGKITLVENDEILADDAEIADRFTKYFIEAVSSLGIEDNKSLLNNVMILMILFRKLFINLRTILVFVKSRRTLQ